MKLPHTSFHVKQREGMRADPGGMREGRGGEGAGLQDRCLDEQSQPRSHPQRRRCPGAAGARAPARPGLAQPRDSPARPSAPGTRRRRREGQRREEKGRGYRLLVVRVGRLFAHFFPHRDPSRSWSSSSDAGRAQQDLPRNPTIVPPHICRPRASGAGLRRSSPRPAPRAAPAPGRFSGARRGGPRLPPAKGSTAPPSYRSRSSSPAAAFSPFPGRPRRRHQRKFLQTAARGGRTDEQRLLLLLPTGSGGGEGRKRREGRR